MFNWLKKIFAPISAEGDFGKTIFDEVSEPTHTAESLGKLTKAQLEKLGRENGVELDKRKKKATLIEELLTVL